MTEKKEYLHDTSPERLARLLAIGAEEPSADGPRPDKQDKAALLRERLAGPLPPPVETDPAMPTAMGRLCPGSGPTSGQSVKDALLDENTDLRTIQAVKNHARRQGRPRTGGPEHGVAIAIYYAAIAHALVYHDRKITEHAYSYLSDSFATLRDKDWVAPELAELFAKAADICKRKRT